MTFTSSPPGGLLATQHSLAKTAVGPADIVSKMRGAFGGAMGWAKAHPRTTTATALTAPLVAGRGIQAMTGSTGPMAGLKASPAPEAPAAPPKAPTEPGMLESAWGQVQPHLQSAWGSVKPHLGQVGDFMENHPYLSGGIGGAGLIGLMSLMNRDDEDEEKRGYELNLSVPPGIAGAGLGAGIGAARAPHGHRAEGVGRGALAGIGTELGMELGSFGGAGLGLAGGAGLAALIAKLKGTSFSQEPGLVSGLGGAGMGLGAIGGMLGGGVGGHKLMNRVMGKPSWDQDDSAAEPKPEVEAESENKEGAARGATFFPRGLLARTRRPSTG